MSAVLRTLVLAGLLAGTSAAQGNPPVVRLDLIIFRVDFGGDNAGIGLQWPRVGVEIDGIVGVAVGAPDPPPPPPPAVVFAELETMLANKQQELATLLQSGAPAEQIQLLVQAINAIVEAKSSVAAQVV